MAIVTDSVLCSPQRKKLWCPISYFLLQSETVAAGKGREMMRWCFWKHQSLALRLITINVRSHKCAICRGHLLHYRDRTEFKTPRQLLCTSAADRWSPAVLQISEPLWSREQCLTVQLGTAQMEGRAGAEAWSEDAVGECTQQREGSKCLNALVSHIHGSMEKKTRTSRLMEDRRCTVVLVVSRSNPAKQDLE